LSAWDAVLEGWFHEYEPVVADTTIDDSLPAMADRILSSVKDPFAIAGVSMGGYVTLEVLKKAKERVTHFALLDTNAHGDSPETVLQREQAIKMTESGQYLDYIVPAIKSMALGKSSLKNDKLLQKITDMAMNVGPKCFIRQTLAIKERPDFSHILPQCQQPAMILYGEEDMLSSPEDHITMADMLPNAVLEVIKDCGHSSPIEKPVEVQTALLNLLDR
jgi:pimeloyl-ACP methyl ester carboxylesterase